MRGLRAATAAYPMPRRFDDAGPERLHDHIGVVREIQEERLLLRVFQIQRHGALAARDVAEPHAGAVRRARAHDACRFAGAVSGLDHDDLGAVIGHGHGQMRAGQVLRQVEDAQA